MEFSDTCYMTGKSCFEASVRDTRIAVGTFFRYMRDSLPVRSASTHTKGGVADFGCT